MPIGNQERYMRGAFVSYEPGKFPDSAVYIPFRANPESLSRSLKIEQGQSSAGTPGGSGDKGAKQQSADASMGVVTESFSIKVRFDVAERGVNVQQKMPLEDGILPEIGAMESLMYPFQSTSSQATDGDSAPYKTRSLRKVTLFLFGKYLTLPVRITGMTINETMHNFELIPLRAEVDVQCEVLDQFEQNLNKAAKAALNFQEKRRNRNAKLAIKASADLIFNTVKI